MANFSPHYYTILTINCVHTPNWFTHLQPTGQIDGQNDNSVLTVHQLTSTQVDTVPQLSAYNSGIIAIPPIMTHCSPHSIDTDLHSASTLYWSINQTKCSISAKLDSYIQKER